MEKDEYMTYDFRGHTITVKKNGLFDTYVNHLDKEDYYDIPESEFHELQRKAYEEAKKGLQPQTGNINPLESHKLIFIDNEKH